MTIRKPVHMHIGVVCELCLFHGFIGKERVCELCLLLGFIGKERTGGIEEITIYQLFKSLLVSCLLYVKVRKKYHHYWSLS